MTRIMGEWRKIETAVSDGPGQERTEESYQFGAEIDGIFVPAVTKSAGYIDALVQRGQEAQERDQDAQRASGGTSDTPAAGDAAQSPAAATTATQTGTGEGGAS